MTVLLLLRGPGETPPAPPPTLEPIRDLVIGRIALPTIFDDVKETIGNSVETAGLSASLGERQPRPFAVTLPVHGDHHDSDPVAVGERARRQLRALLDNPAARAQGTYLAFAPDPDLNGWLLIGGGDLEYGQGGITFADFTLALTDCYRLGSRRTHRSARTLWLLDRRLATTPRDTLETVFSEDFADQDATARLVLPVGATDLLGAAGEPLTPAAYRSTGDGDLAVLDGRTHLETVSYEQDEADQGKADVLALDRRGVAAPTQTEQGDLDPQGHYGWEELYGPDQQLSADDMPVLQNGVCRVRWVDEIGLGIDAFVGAVGYVEQARVTLWTTAPTLPALVHGLAGARIVEWTPERAVVAAVLGLPSGERAELYVTLQRGWSAPRVEAYVRSPTDPAPWSALQVMPATAGDTTVGNSTGSTTVVDATVHLGSFSACDWAYLLPQSPNLALHMAVLQANLWLVGRSDLATYGSARKGVLIEQPPGDLPAGYVSVQLGVGARGAEAADAQDLGETVLYDARQAPELVER